MIKSLTKVAARKRAAEEEIQEIVEHDSFYVKEEERVVNRVIKSYGVVAGLHQSNSTAQFFCFPSQMRMPTLLCTLCTST